MSRISEAWVETTDDMYYFSDTNKFGAFLKENPKDIVSIQITETMTRDEFNKMHPDLVLAG